MLSAIALGAAVLSAAPGGGYSLSVYPAAVQAPQGTSHATFTVRDSGKTALSLVARAIEMRPVKGQPGMWVPTKVFEDATVSPSRVFSLKPGESRTITVTVHSTDGYAHRLQILTEIVTPNVKAGASVSPAVGAKYQVTGKENPYESPVSAATPTEPSPFPWEYVGYGAAGLAAVYGAYKLRKVRVHFTKVT